MGSLSNDCILSKGVFGWGTRSLSHYSIVVVAAQVDITFGNREWNLSGNDGALLQIWSHGGTLFEFSRLLQNCSGIASCT
jgi:hypothetical protein